MLVLRSHWLTRKLTLTGKSLLSLPAGALAPGPVALTLHIDDSPAITRHTVLPRATR
jgi:hypothetical protein